MLRALFFSTFPSFLPSGDSFFSHLPHQPRKSVRVKQIIEPVLKMFGGNFSHLAIECSDFVSNIIWSIQQQVRFLSKNL